MQLFSLWNKILPLEEHFTEEESHAIAIFPRWPPIIYTLEIGLSFEFQTFQSAETLLMHIPNNSTNIVFWILHDVKDASVIGLCSFHPRPSEDVLSICWPK